MGDVVHLETEKEKRSQSGLSAVFDAHEDYKSHPELSFDDLRAMVYNTYGKDLNEYDPAAGCYRSEPLFDPKHIEPIESLIKKYKDSFVEGGFTHPLLLK